jgi:hypothetical protein
MACTMVLRNGGGWVMRVLQLPTTYVPYYLPLNAYVLKREGNSVARSLQGGSRPLYASYLRTEHEAVATELLERAAEASASVHAAGKDGWLGKVGRGDVRRGEARETRVCSGLTG